MVINSDPCISYLMEENTATMQALVIAHAAFGHNHFFRNNHVFRQWTEPSAILDYLGFARQLRGAMRGSARHVAAVERILDAAHSLSRHGVHRHGRSQPLNLRTEERREQERRDYDERVFDDLWRTLPDKPADLGRHRHGGRTPPPAWPARGEPALFPGEVVAPAAKRGNGRSSVSCG